MPEGIGNKADKMTYVTPQSLHTLYNYITFNDLYLEVSYYLESKYST